MIKHSAIAVLAQVIRVWNYSQKPNLCKCDGNCLSSSDNDPAIHEISQECIKLTKE